MKKRNASYLTVALIVLIAAFAVPAAAQEVIYISEPSLSDGPRILPRFEAPVDRDFERNPALLTLECPYEFFSDLTYHGGTYKVSTDGVWGPNAIGNTAFAFNDSSYYLHALGGDAGFAMKLGDTTNLAALVSYRWGYLFGDTDFEYYSPLNAASFFGSSDERLNAHTFGLSLLLNHAFSDSFTLGTGLTYSYNTERLTREGSGNGRFGAAPALESLLIDRELRLNYHRFAPVLGVLITPSDRFKIDASVEAGFSFGGVSKDSLLYDNRGPGANDWYAEDLDSRDLFGWDIAAKVRPLITLSDRLSIPLVLDFTYRTFDWSVDGAAYGYFMPVVYGGIFQGQGLVDYENSMKSWDITAGAGLTYDAGWATLAGMLSYTHRDFRNGYDQENLVTGATAPGLTAFSQRDNEIKDTISLGVMVEKKFSPMISAALGLRYDLGWGKREYYTSYFSPYETAPVEELIVATADRDMYQDLTLTTGLTLSPIERLTIGLGGMVKFPLDSLDYEGDTTAVGWPLGTTSRFPSDSLFTRDYESSGWEYGGTLTITYEFGCAKPVPPVKPAPVIEPKLEPMSLK